MSAPCPHCGVTITGFRYRNGILYVEADAAKLGSYTLYQGELRRIVDDPKAARPHTVLRSLAMSGLRYNAHYCSVSPDPQLTTTKPAIRIVARDRYRR